MERPPKMLGEVSQIAMNQIRTILKDYCPSTRLEKERARLIMKNEEYKKKGECSSSSLAIFEEQLNALEVEDRCRFIRERVILTNPQVEIINGRPDYNWFKSKFIPKLRDRPLKEVINSTLDGLLLKPLRPMRFNLFEVERASDSEYFQIRIWLGKPRKCNSYLI